MLLELCGLLELGVTMLAGLLEFVDCSELCGALVLEAGELDSAGADSSPPTLPTSVISGTDDPDGSDEFSESSDGYDESGRSDDAETE